MSKRILSLDLETTAAPGFEEYEDAALDFNRNAVTLVATADDRQEWVSRSLADLPADCDYITHNGKFDFKTALSKSGHRLTLEQYKHDTMLMLVALPHKIDEGWLLDYEAARKQLNKELGGQVHRQAGKYSLKTAAPYFLGVDPFWEVADHNDISYAKKDARYTYDLYLYLRALLEEGGHYEFYERCLMPWSRMLLRAEMLGMPLDRAKLEAAVVEHRGLAEAAEAELREIWRSPIAAIQTDKVIKVTEAYREKEYAAIAKLTPSKKKDPAKALAEDKEKRERTTARYTAMRAAAISKIEAFKFSSPSQLKTLFQSMGWDLTNFDGDESTGKEVLERLLREGQPGIARFLDWRKSYKLSTAFFPSYLEMQVGDVIHTSFNLNGTRTGRLSSSSPNCQQLPTSNLDIFAAAPGELIVYRDASAIEPRLMAYQTECYELCRIFIEGSDFHSFNVRTALGIEEDDETIKTRYKKERDLMKEVGLSLMYGASWKRIQAASGKRGMPLSAKQCKAMFLAFQEKYQEVWEYKAAIEERIKSGEIITNVLGRPLSYDMDRLHMQSLNTLIQSGASDLVVESARMFEEGGGRPALLIHDAIAARSPRERAKKDFDALGSILLGWKLETKWGPIPLKSEGGISMHLGGEDIGEQL